MKLREKVALYETMMHRISMANTAMNNERIREYVGRIDAWSYAHRCGNGELSDKQQQACIDAAAKRLIEG